jgi:hypothetical protein
MKAQSGGNFRRPPSSCHHGLIGLLCQVPVRLRKDLGRELRVGRNARHRQRADHHRCRGQGSLFCEIRPSSLILGRDNLHEPQEAIRGHRPNALLTASDFAAESGERAAVSGIIPVISGKVSHRGCFESALRGFSCGGCCERIDHRLHGGGARLCDELVLGLEVPIEPAMSEAGRGVSCEPTFKTSRRSAACASRVGDPPN